MEPRDHVNNNNDGERLPPQGAQPQEDNSWWNDGLLDFTNIDPHLLNYESAQGDSTAVPAPVNGPHAQLTTPSSNEWSYPVVDEAIRRSFTPGPNDSNTNRDHQVTVSVNGLEHSEFSHILANVDLFTAQQTTANAPINLSDHRLDLAQSQVAFTDLPKHLHSGDAIFYNKYSQPSYPAQPSTYMNQPLRSQPTNQPAFMTSHSATSPPAEAPKRLRKRRRASTDPTETPEPSRLKRSCAGCDKSFYSSKDPNRMRCTRCYDKHVKHTAGHTTYHFDPNTNVDSAWLALYPRVIPLALPGDDVEFAKTHDLDYCRRLIEAISLPYVSDGTGSKEDLQRVAQQTKLNRKPYDSAQYRDNLVNARVRFLFQIALSYHAGGPSMYDTGGDNSGYGEDRTMKFSDRMERIIQLLTTDKDIAMDVIEGRGVTALVHNPDKYERRKRDNKKSNDTKQDLQEKGKKLHMLEAEAVGADVGVAGGAYPSAGSPNPFPDAALSMPNDGVIPHANNVSSQHGFSTTFGGSSAGVALQRRLGRDGGMGSLAEAETDVEGWHGDGEFGGGELEGYEPARFP